MWLLGALTVAAVLTWPVSGVAVRVDGRCVLFLPLREEEPLELSWRHSVDHILVRDLFTRRRGALCLLATYNPFFAAGLGEVPGRGRLAAVSDHGLAILDMNERLDSLPLRIGSAEVAHTLHHRGQAYDLSARFPRRPARLQAEWRTRLGWWLHDRDGWHGDA